ncbi:cobalamin-5'-phosphate synthase [Dethiosulfatibacter aminovorans DSM 17477]|uniref:Adenosylcobinamide-GDP ribazoletransferase n=1 Tax=Dethiosulfatibacter aminovorans DSM 17477 TaxID=1121476 RepID=A0A1M6GRA9_9FIRM|nr:adenosylcobinamide-GDP ribazoletransferase [Dethiosulfatibacter aminovorans]SHJ12452.1 cobalamin-5'-phosphate synthase [Dethiosulfatibacter aminovorans DSM 17477]
MKNNMKQIMRSLSMMIAFFTRIPMKYGHEFDEDDYCIGIMFLPVIGLIIGLGLFVLKHALFFASPYVGGLVMLIFYIWITGGLHIDGLADTFDGIFSGRDRDRMFEIMKDSRVGSFGAISISLLMISYVILFAENTPGAILMMGVVGKSSVLSSASISSYAKEEMGLGTMFVENCGERERYIGILFTALVSVFAGYKLMIPAGITFVLVALITQYLKKVLGGTTGDTMGFIGELSQIIFLILSSIIY